MTKKLTLTKRKSISECKKLWKAIDKSGLLKYEYLHSEDGRKWYDKKYHASCPLCEYAHQVSNKFAMCGQCPLVTQYDKHCWELGFENTGETPPTPEWFEAVRGLK